MYRAHEHLLNQGLESSNLEHLQGSLQVLGSQSQAGPGTTCGCLPVLFPPYVHIYVLILERRPTERNSYHCHLLWAQWQPRVPSVTRCSLNNTEVGTAVSINHGSWGFETKVKGPLKNTESIPVRLVCTLGAAPLGFWAAFPFS